jgi:hypothetical protein
MTTRPRLRLAGAALSLALAACGGEAGPEVVAPAAQAVSVQHAPTQLQRANAPLREGAGDGDGDSNPMPGEPVAPGGSNPMPGVPDPGVNGNANANANENADGKL